MWAQKCVILTFSQGRFRQMRRNSSAGLSWARGGWHTKGHQRQAELTKVISVKRLTCHCFCSCSSEHMFGRAPSLPLSGWNLNPAQMQLLTAPLFGPAVTRSVILPSRTTDEDPLNVKHLCSWRWRYTHPRINKRCGISFNSHQRNAWRSSSRQNNYKNNSWG